MLPFARMLEYGNTVIPEVRLIEKFSISTNGSGVLILYTNGDLYAFGTNTSGKFGTGNTNDITGAWLKIASNVRKFSCGTATTIIIKKDGTVQYSGNITNVMPGSFGYGLVNTMVFTDMTAAFSTFDINGIQDIVLNEDEDNRLWVIDKTNHVYGIGYNTYYALGTGSVTGATNWTVLPNGDNVQKLQPGKRVLWVQKYDGTIYRVGTNSYGTLAFSTTSGSYQTLQIWNSSPTKEVAVTPYNLYILLQDGTMREYGISGSGQLGNGSTSAGTVLLPYTPSITGVKGLMSGGGYYYSTYVKGNNTLLSTGSNSTYMLGTGISTNPTTTFTNSSTGVMSNLDYSNLDYLGYAIGAAYAVIDNEVYCAGSPSMTLSPAVNTTWSLMNTPLSALWGSGSTVTTFSNISTSTPNMMRYSHSTCPYGQNKFILYGGYRGTTVLNDINIYDASTNTWSTVPVTANTQARFGAGIAVHNDKLYVFGGTDASSTIVNTTYVVDLVTGVWTLLSTTGTPSARTHVRMCNIGSLLYVWGGQGFSNLYSFNPSTNTYITLSSSIGTTAGINGDMCTDGTDLYISTTDTNFQKYDISTGLWTLLSTKGNGEVKLTYSNGYVYSMTTSGNQLRAYRISTNIWSTIGSGAINTDRFCLSAGAGKVYFSGGAASTTTNNFYVVQ